VLIAVSGCGGAEERADAGADAAARDAGPPDAGPFMPDLECPGGPGCTAGGDGMLFAGAAAVAITPTVDDTTEVLTLDVNGNGSYDPEEGDTFRDTNGNGALDGIWIAGFGNGRAATGVNDDQWARALVLRDGDITLAIVAVDAVGLFYDDVLLVREALSDLDVDYVTLAATHSHQAKDTMGIWGRTYFETGLDHAYQETIRAASVRAVREAVAGLERVNVQYASLRLRDVPGGVLRYVGDNRDPQILDDEARVMRFVRAGADTTVATLTNFAAHPEYAGSENTLLSSDYVHWLRAGIEDGVTGADGARRDGVGGIAVFVNGALGCQIGPNGIDPRRWDGTPPDRGLDRAHTIGEQLAWHVLGALGPDGGSTTDETAVLGVRTRTLFLDVQNRKYHFAAVGELFERRTYHWDETRPLLPGRNEPDVMTEIAVIDVGRAQFLTAPGEMDPALFVGGYDGAYTPEGVMIVDPDNPNPPDLSRAPPPPYLRDRMRADAEMRGVFGLTSDQLGYLIPSFNYELASPGAYFDEAAGDHYDETNSLGPDAWPNLERELNALLAWPAEP